MKIKTHLSKLLVMFLAACMIMPAWNREAHAEGMVSTDLTAFLKDVIIDALVDENGSYVIDPKTGYEVTLFFGENESLQFDNDAVKTYSFPEGMMIPDIGATAFSISITDENGTATVQDNTFEVVNGQLRVHFNQNDPNFERLTATSNVRFGVTITARMDSGTGRIEFAPGLSKDFVYEENADLSITKSVMYNAEEDKAYYTLQISSAGANENVVIEDLLTGTALTLEHNVSITSNLSGTLALPVDYESVVNGFRVGIPRLAHNEVLTLHYSATVDNTKISSNGTEAQTGNTAKVTSDQVPNGKMASANFAGQVRFHRISKASAGDLIDQGDGSYETAWAVNVNQDHKMQMGDTDISDWIASESRPFMLFSGTGITVAVTFESGETETRTVPWEDLYLYRNDQGIYGWRYHTPETDGKASYVITCTTLIQTAGALNTLTLFNGAQVFNSYSEATVTVQGIGDNVFSQKKEALGTTAEQSEWQIIVTVPGSGLDDLRVTDDLPRLEYEESTYIDNFIEGSIEIEGLLEGESWSQAFNDAGNSFTLTFYKNEQMDRGILATPDNEPRDIVIRYKTMVDHDWLNLAAENGYNNTSLYRHRNIARARSGNYRLPASSADVFPVKPSLEKSFIERTETQIDGITFPVFHYSLLVSGMEMNHAVIQESFDTEWLRPYEEIGVQVSGGRTATANEGVGQAHFEITDEGANLYIDELPTHNGGYYPYYKIQYALIVKDKNSLDSLNQQASQAQEGVTLTNIASWEDLTTNTQISYTYYPYVDKELVTRPSENNGYVAEFKILINQYAEDLDPASDTLMVRDILSSNLRFLPDSLRIMPANDLIVVQYDGENNALTFTNIPDETAFEVTYQAKVLGKGNVTYSNTIQLGSFEKIVEETVTITSSGSGTASNPSITLVKRDAENMYTTLSGAVFQLFTISDDGSTTPIRDINGQDVLFTTDENGTVLIIGNQQRLGWTLWEDRTYALIEVQAPDGYVINEEPTVFRLSSFPEEQTDYDIFGDQISILNTREPEEPIDPGTDTSEPEEQDETEPNDSDHDGSSEEEPSSNDSDPQEPGSSDKDNKDPKENKPKTSTLDHKYTEATRKKNPLTGDRSNTGGYLFLLFLALVCLVLTFIKKKR